MNVIRIEWTEITAGIIVLAEKLKHGTVWGVPRGGRMIATLLSYHPGFELDLNIHPMPGSTVVDDIAETGQTMSKYKGFKRAALYVRDCSDRTVHAYAYRILHRHYLLFPWELEPEFGLPDVGNDKYAGLL